MPYYIITTSKDQDGRTWYGAAALCEGKIQIQYDDISTDAAPLSELICNLNRLGASILHFNDIIYDYIADIRE